MGCQQTKIRELSDEDVDFLKTHTKYDEQTIREWYEGFKVDCPSGRLSRKKFIDIYRTFFPTGNPEKFCDHVFRTFDTDNSGHIDFKEFLMAIGITASSSGEERLKWAFRMYDINNDGGIELTEMTKIVKVRNMIRDLLRYLMYTYDALVELFRECSSSFVQYIINPNSSISHSLSIMHEPYLLLYI